MRRYATARLTAYATFALIGLLAALLLGRPEPAVLALPFAALAAAGAALRPEADVTVATALDRVRVLEQEDVVLEVEVGAAQALQVEVRPVLPAGITSTGAALQVLGLQPGRSSSAQVTVRAHRWGVHTLGQVRLRARSTFGVYLLEGVAGAPISLRVFPRPERLGTLPRPAATQLHAGDQVARAVADGIEFAEVGPALAGERLTRVNWRVTARRGEVHVNRRHPERNVDAVLFLDSFAGAGAPGSGTHDRAVELAAALAAAYLRRRDRVSLISFGGILRWLRPGGGGRQLYQLLDALLESQVIAGYAWKGVEAIPRGVLPAGALVLAVSPLLDERSVAALAELAGRGFEVAILEPDASAYVQPRGDEAGRLAYRLWRLRQEAARDRLRGAGIVVAQTEPGEPAEVAASRLLAAERRRRWRSPATIG